MNQPKGDSSNGSSLANPQSAAAFTAFADLALGTSYGCLDPASRHRQRASFAGLGLLLCWLGTLAAGPDAYALFLAQAGTWYGRIVLIGVSWSVFNHAVSGVRHFLLDIGAGFEVKSNNFWSAICPVIGILLTAAFWACLLAR
jgi:succinate dehydrogenase / fumarate reductase cytochrome b subunit